MDNRMKFSWGREWPMLAAVAAAWALGLYFYGRFPETVVSHWNFAGRPDGYSGRAAGAFGLPGVISGIYLLMLVLPSLDPKAGSYASFDRAYQFIKGALVMVLLAIFVLAGLYNLGYPISIGTAVPVAVGLLLAAIGNVMGKVRPNWFVGIKTPWTLSSENVWTKTHRLGGYLLVAYGIVLAATPLLPEIAAQIGLFGGAAILVLGTFGYSYWAYRSERRQGPALH